MIIEPERYNEIRVLLIGIGTTGSQGHICYWDGVWRVSISAAVHMGVEEMGMQTRNRVHTISLWVGNESRYACGH